MAKSNLSSSLFAAAAVAAAGAAGAARPAVAAAVDVAGLAAVAAEAPIGSAHSSSRLRMRVIDFSIMDRGQGTVADLARILSRVDRSRLNSASPLDGVSPAARPLRLAGAAELRGRLALACRNCDGLTGAHCVHELWMRGELAANIEQALERLWRGGGHRKPPLPPAPPLSSCVPPPLLPP